MAKFEWQNGTLVSKAKVEINGEIYEVEPEQYSGTTPLTAENMNAMQDGIYEDIDKKIDGYNIETNGSAVKTGRMIDGKEEYVQVVNVGSCPNNKQTEVPYQTDDKFITDYYLIAISSNNEIIKVPNASASTLYFNAFFTNNKIAITTNQDRSRFTGYVYVFFTYK